MNGIQHIGAFYSRGPHFRRLLRHLRARFPGARISAVVPPSYPGGHIAGLADEVLVTARSDRAARAFFSVLRQVRAANFDLFVTMFDSPRLRVLSQLSAARYRCCFTPDGRFFTLGLPLPGTVPGPGKGVGGSSLIRIAARSLYASLRGRLRYRYLHYIVHHRPVDKGSNRT